MEKKRRGFFASVNSQILVWYVLFFFIWIEFDREKNYKDKK